LCLIFVPVEHLVLTSDCGSLPSLTHYQVSNINPLPSLPTLTHYQASQH